MFPLLRCWWRVDAFGSFFGGGSLLAEVVEVLALYVPIFLSEL